MMRFLKSFVFLTGSGLAFSVPFFERLPYKSVVPYVLQMLIGWALLFAALYQLIQGVRTLVTRGEEKP